MFCNKCGNKVNSNQKFCSKCGNEIKQLKKFCNKCGTQVSSSQKFCNKCGNKLLDNVEKTINTHLNYNNTKKEKKKITIVLPISIILSVLVFILLVIVGIYFIISNTKSSYYFDDIEIGQAQINQSDTKTSGSNISSKGKYRTDIITDNTYSGISVKNKSDAHKLIVQDSVNQKQSNYPKEIIEIENEIIQKYSITAVNLKEMDVEFAKELENVLDKIYKEYPNARKHLTNLTLIDSNNTDANVIAQFMPIFVFGTSNTSTSRPWVIKTQVQLNSRYFLNPEKLEKDAKSGSKSGHFPPNATKYSALAHELGHYLSFIAVINYYSTDSIVTVEDGNFQNYYNLSNDYWNMIFSKKMLDEAYQNYIKDNGNIDFDKWRGQISMYALAKSDDGEYLYDETVAEAFHDVYLNGNNASVPSKYIVEVLKKYVESR